MPEVCIAWASGHCDLPAALRLLIAYTMVSWVEFRVSAASSRAFSRIAVLAILQTIATN
jgi:hypothetical protein